MVIDHLAKPGSASRSPRIGSRISGRRRHYPRVYCKLSGMITEADWTHWKPSDLRPYVQAALELFGPERLMFRARSWPVPISPGGIPR